MAKDDVNDFAQALLVGGNALSWGLPHAFTGEDYDRRLAEARKDLGLGAAALDVGGAIAGGGILGGLAKGAFKAVAPSLMGRVVTPALRTIGGVIKRNPWKTGLGTLVYPGTTAAVYSSDAYGNGSAPDAPVAAAAVAEPGAPGRLASSLSPAAAAAADRAFMDPRVQQAYARGGIRSEQAQRGPPTANDMLEGIMRAQGGGISMEQLDALGQYAARTAAPPARLPRYQDVAMPKALQEVDDIFTQNKALADSIMNSQTVPEHLRDKYSSDPSKAARLIRQQAEKDYKTDKYRLLGVKEEMFPEEEGN